MFRELVMLDTASAPKAPKSAELCVEEGVYSGV